MKENSGFHLHKRICFLLIIAAALACLISWRYPNRWTVTQYASQSDAQAMIYTITDRRGHFVIVDGGYDTDAEFVRKLIAKHHDHVDAWIITHTHPDHAGAFNAIMFGPENDIQIDHLYTVNANTDRYRETAQPYDRFDVHEMFEQLTADMPQVEYLAENDELDLIGLRMKVLSAWDERVDALKDHLCNDGSMMFRIEGKANSMLFCADVQKEMEQYILPAHKDELKCDYVQCGHHGNWGLTTEFYDYVEPKAAFMDAPGGLFVHDENNEKYDGYLLKEYFDERGVKVYTFDDAPSKVVLR